MKAKYLISSLLTITLVSNYSCAVLSAEALSIDNNKLINSTLTNNDKPNTTELNGWVFKNSKWFYYSQDVLQKSFINIDKDTFYLNNNGEMVTGWSYINNNWYYFKPNGSMTKGWIKLNNIWYYLKDNGQMATGFIDVDGKRYFLDKSGAMKTGWVKINNLWYHFDTSGNMSTGWITSYGYKYYLNLDGSMATNIIIDGYVIDNSGIATLNSITKFSKAEEAAREFIDSKDVGVFCMDLNTGESFGINHDKLYYTASSGKLTAILYAQKRLNEGSLSLNDTFKYSDSINDTYGSYQRGGTGILQSQLKEGDMVSVERMLKATCIYSDNLGANLLGHHVSNESDDDFKAYIKKIVGREMINFTHKQTPKELALLLREIYKEGGQSINYLTKVVSNPRISKYLPVKVASKIGIHNSANNDIAIVYTDNPYVLAVMTPNLSNDFIGQLSKKIYDQLK